MALKVEDFVLDKRFRKWVLDPDQELCTYWEQYLLSYPYQQKSIEEAKTIILNVPQIKYALKDQEVEELWQDINKKIDAADGTKQKVIPFHNIETYHRQKKVASSMKWTRYAAVFVLLVSAVFAFFIVKNTSLKEASEAEEWVTKETFWGQKSTIFLSDGSEVILNSGSSISYLKNFKEDERLVKLSGEAFFTVSRDSLRPFRVQTGGVTTQALGTSFNISAYLPDENVDISLVTGRVLVRSNDKEVFLYPGEKIVYTNQDKSFEKSFFDAISTIGWKDRILVFTDANQEQVFDKLGKWYGVEFDFLNTSNKQWNYNAEFKNLDLKNVLGSIGFAMDFDYIIKDDLVQIKFNHL